MFQSLLTTALLLAPPTGQQGASGPIFPPSSGPLTIEISADVVGITYLELVQQYGALTGQHITFDSDTRELLHGNSVHLDRTAVVPASEVQAFVEHLLIRGDFAFSLLKTRGVRLLEVTSVVSRTGQRLRKNAHVLEASRIDVARAHPAVMFQAVLPMPNTDTQVLSNAMRSMIPDASTQSILPAGNTNSMILVGFGSQLAAMADMLRAIDEAALPPAAVSDLVFEVVVLEKADATVIAQTVTELLGGAPPERGEGGGPERAGPEHAGPWPRQARVVADPRTNSLFVFGTKAQIENLQALIARLDR